MIARLHTILDRDRFSGSSESLGFPDLNSVFVDGDSGSVAANESSVSVVIPSIGRLSLSRALESVYAQTLRPSQVIVVDDSPGGIPREIKTHWAEVTWLQGERRGAATARNLGVRNSSSNWIAFLDDDDWWMDGKLAAQISEFLPSDEVVISCGAIVALGVRQRTRPKLTFPIGASVLDVFYARFRVGSSPYYLPTPSLVVPTRIALQNPFDESLEVREDIWWLHQLQTNGVRIVQLRDMYVWINSSHDRGRHREKLDTQLEWAQRLASWRRDTAVGYLRGVAIRDSVLSLDFPRIPQLLKAARALREFAQPEP